MHVMMTSEEAFREAERHEKLAFQCGFGDPYWIFAQREIEFYLGEAARLEQQERATSRIFTDHGSPLVS